LHASASSRRAVCSERQDQATRVLTMLQSASARTEAPPRCRIGRMLFVKGHDPDLRELQNTNNLDFSSNDRIYDGCLNDPGAGAATLGRKGLPVKQKASVVPQSEQLCRCCHKNRTPL